MAGFRAAGWMCCGTVAVALVIAVVGMRGVGLVGQQRPGVRAEKPGEDIELATRKIEPSSDAANVASERASVVTLAADAPDAAGKPGKAETAPEV